MVRVVHFSDWHAQWKKLPEADLYVCTGDMHPDFLQNEIVNDRPHKWPHRRWFQDPLYARREQLAWAHLAAHGLRDHLGSPDAPVVAVRGNHDFADLATLFRCCNLVHEFLDNEIVEVCGLKITGHRGIPYINGMWSDETQRPELLERVRAMTCEGVNLVLTHYSSAGILDRANSGHTGLEGMASALYNRILPGGAHMFGHIHEEGGKVHRHGDVYFSNAATAFNILEIKPCSKTD